MNTHRHSLLVLLLVLPAGALAAPAAGQAPKLSEDFEDLAFPPAGAQGPQALIDRGWTFRNQADPLGSVAFRPGGLPGFAHSGSGFLAAHSSAAGMFGAKVSSWAILPPVPGQAAGDLVTVQALDGGYHNADTFLEVRYSPSGGTDTGSGPFDVGDFTDVLFAGELPLTGQFVYEAVSAALPGAGRIALRFHTPSISNFQTVAILFLDTLTVGGEQPPPCGLALPEGGETVTWDAAGSPYTVCQTLVVPAGATLVIEAGATVHFDGNLLVEGVVRAEGTEQEPVTLLGDNVSGLQVEGGAVRLDFADVGASVSVHQRGTLEAYDSVFRHQGWLSTLSVPAFTRLVRCDLESETVSFNGTAVLDDVSILDPSAHVSIHGFWNVLGLDSAAPITFIASMQDRVVDHVTVTGAGTPALELSATGGAVDFLLGSGNLLSGNEYPVWTRFAGLRPESTVPASGNVNDAILGFDNLRADLRSRPSLPDFGVPYDFHERGRAAGRVAIAPGTLLRFGPQGGMTVTADLAHDPVLRGLPGEPIRFERLFPGQEWLSLASDFGLTVFEHLAVDGAGIGVVASETEMLLRDCTISGCSIGATPASDGHIFGSGVRFLDNDLGLQNDTTHLASAIGTGIHFDGDERPNVFEGNLLAAENVPTTNGHHHEFPAAKNWWGHPSGPFDPLSNPQGQGDPVSWVDYSPFLTSAPDLSDERPVVRLVTRLHPAVLPGEKIFVEWEAFDDGKIVSFDVQVLTDDIDAPYQTYVDLRSNLPGTARRCEVVVPDVGLHPYERFPFRIVATDDAGNVGFEQFQVTIPSKTPPGSVTFHPLPEGLRGGEDVQVCYDAFGIEAIVTRMYVETASDDRMKTSAGTGSGCTLATVRMPFASTDRARLAFRAVDNFNRDEWYFSDHFTIRPDPRIGDAAPAVAMTAPLHGDAFVRVIPISWTADDDHGLHEFRIQASFNGGFSFHTIAASLPPTDRSYAWRIPPSTGIDDLRVRVVAVDTLLQNTSDGDERVLGVRPTLPLARRRSLTVK